MKISKERIKELYLSGKTLKEISKIAECHLSNIYGHLNRMNVPRRSVGAHAIKYEIDLTFFEKIDTEEKAYILGLLYADGYNNEKSGTVSLRLQTSDLEILLKIKKALKYTGVIFFAKNYCDITFSRRKISDDLAKLGCVQRKSLILKYPNFLDLNLERHFIRGYFDGDGCISIGNQVQLTILGTLDFISKIQNHLVSKLDINFTQFSKRYVDTETYTMRYKGRKNVFKIANYLYKDSSIYLERKFKLYCTLLK